eukprot:1550541-Alexandrium_andersonii.AAC.1
MSASLVGSEMCIRDRACCALPASLRSSTPSRPHARAGSKLWSFRRPARPVSYTHLTLPTICSV